MSDAVVQAAPSCANVSSMFVRAPENELNHGFGMTMGTWGDQTMKDRFSDAYARAFKLPLLEQNFYPPYRLERNFRPYNYPDLAAQYPCVVVRSSVELTNQNSIGLLALKPNHCLIEWVHVYTIGIPCENIQLAFSARSSSHLASTESQR